MQNVVRDSSAMWPARLLVLGAVVIWSAVASMLAAPIVGHIVGVGTSIGVLMARRIDWKLVCYTPVGVVGALVGALLSFGDAPVLMRYPVLNPWTLSIVGALLLAATMRMLDQRMANP